MKPLFVALLVIVLYNIISNVIELDKLNKQLKELTNTHNQLEDIHRKKYNNTVEYYEGLIKIKNTQIKKLNEEKAYMNNKILLPLGEFEATAYDLSVQSCGKQRANRGYGVTANGTQLANHTRKTAMTVAVDPDVIPLGTQIYIKFPKPYNNYNGIYTANDTGSAIKNNIIDIFMGDFQSDKTSSEVWEFGRRKVEVYQIIKDKE